MMREKHERDVQRLIGLIVDGSVGRVDALERSIACLALAVGVVQEAPGGGLGRGSFGSTTAEWGSMGRKVRAGLVSFGWIVAAACLKELERYEFGEFGKKGKEVFGGGW